MNIRCRLALKNALLSAVRVYWSFSSLLSPRCRFWPSCSHYAFEAIDTHGAGRGIRLALKRFLRCHPLGGHGFDPVPQEIK